MTSPSRRRRSSWCPLIVAVLSALVALAGQQVVWAAPPPAAPANPPDQPGRGLRYDGLHRAAAGACRGKFELRLASGEVACTHGPDAAPPDVDVRQSPDLPPISAADAAAVASMPCQGDGVSGPRVQLVYARASDVADRFAALAPSFQMWAAQVDEAINASAGETGGTRRVRYVHDAGCQPIILRVQFTTAGDDNLTNTINELRSLGHNRSDRKYALWVDANVYCGIAQAYEDDRATQDNNNNGRSGVAGMVARVDRGCWGSSSGLVEVHELVHTLGSVQASAPNSTPNGHCTDDYDRMCYPDDAGVTTRVVCPATSHEHRLDCNHDDYFSTAPPPGSYLATHWNTANSVFLAGGGAPPTTTTLPPPTTTTRPPATTTTTRPPATTTTTTTVPPSLPSQTQRFINRSYVDLLGRAPAAAESQYWLGLFNQGLPRDNYAGALVTSTEYRRRIVDSYYRSYLGRPADPAGMNAYLNLIATQGWRFEWVATLLIGSDEYFNRIGGNPTAFVNSLYANVLGLAPDPAGVTFWVNQLLGGLDRYNVVLAFFMSGVHYGNMVSFSYNYFVDRPPDAEGLAFWMKQMEQGLPQEHVFAFFVGSSEYWAKS